MPHQPGGHNAGSAAGHSCGPVGGEAPGRYLYHRSGPVTLYLGDAAHVLSTLPPGSVDCVVTSPPYWGHRDYRTGTWTGGHPGCTHQPDTARNSGRCPRCGASWFDPQYGLEESIEDYLEHLHSVFAQLRRVLRPEGTCWLNLGDTYSSAAGSAATSGKPDPPAVATGAHPPGGYYRPRTRSVPWRTALMLQADRWWLRQAIIWHKPNALPESVRDRPSISHEYLFLLTRSPRYHFNLDPIGTPPTQPATGRRSADAAGQTDPAGSGRASGKYLIDPAAHHRRPGQANPLPTGTTHTTAHPTGRNPGSVWTIPTRPNRHAHYATFPIDLPLRCIAAGSPPGGAVLDPFAGISTTGLAAVQLGRTYIGIDIHPQFHDTALTRLTQQPPTTDHRPSTPRGEPR